MPATAQPVQTPLEPAAEVKVWDLLVRLGHWGLVGAFCVAYVSADDEGDVDQLHVWAGYAVAAIVVVRLVWGVLGSKYARFSSFAASPVAGFRYLRDMIGGRAKRYVGHSPAGALMVFALLASLSMTVFTGLRIYGDAGHGPLAANGISLIASAKADGRGEREHQEGGETQGEAGESEAGDLHAAFANLTLLLAGLHVAGVALASIQHRENLIASMFTGRKPRR
jgi:cytochrome b